jgi:hypothetical protein
MLCSRLRREFVIFGIVFLAAGQGAPYCSARRIMNLDGAVSLRDEITQPVANKAGFVFSGTVLAVDRMSSAAGVGVDTIRITFAVHEGLRGVRAGKTFTIQEWAGLWSTASGRFRPGERVFLFLYPRSKLGLTSTVGGTSGRYRLDSNWRIAGTNQKPGILLLATPKPRDERVMRRGGLQSRKPTNNKMRELTE